MKYQIFFVVLLLLYYFSPEEIRGFLIFFGVAAIFVNQISTHENDKKD